MAGQSPEGKKGRIREFSGLTKLCLHALRDTDRAAVTVFDEVRDTVFQ